MADEDETKLSDKDNEKEDDAAQPKRNCESVLSSSSWTHSITRKGIRLVLLQIVIMSIADA
jgi:hypothetical protein